LRNDFLRALKDGRGEHLTARGSLLEIHAHQSGHVVALIAITTTTTSVVTPATCWL
jgi:hypothetical protein